VVASGSQDPQTQFGVAAADGTADVGTDVAAMSADRLFLGEYQSMRNNGHFPPPVERPFCCFVNHLRTHSLDAR
jgi:hypothetical protein